MEMLCCFFVVFFPASYIIYGGKGFAYCFLSVVSSSSFKSVPLGIVICLLIQLWVGFVYRDRSG